MSLGCINLELTLEKGTVKSKIVPPNKKIVFVSIKEESYVFFYYLNGKKGFDCWTMKKEEAFRYPAEIAEHHAQDIRSQIAAKKLKGCEVFTLPVNS